MGDTWADYMGSNPRKWPTIVRVASVCVLLAVAWGCDTMNAKVATPPPAPQPQPVRQTAPPEPKLLVLAQNTAEIPATDPVPPESIPPRPSLDAKPADTPEAAVPANRRSTTTGARDPRNRPPDAAPPETLPPVTPPDTTPPAPRALESAEDRAASRVKIEALQSDLHKKIAALGTPANASARNSISRMNSFLRLSAQALKRGDLSQAQTLADRAAALLRDYTRGH